MNAEMDISKNKWRSTGGLIPSCVFGYDFQKYLKPSAHFFHTTCDKIKTSSFPFNRQIGLILGCKCTAVALLAWVLWVLSAMGAIAPKLLRKKVISDTILGVR